MTNDRALETRDNQEAARQLFLDRRRFRSREIGRVFGSLTHGDHPACRITTSDAVD